jgi:hypothetical protein
MDQILLQLASSYGAAGLALAVAVWLLYKLIDRGFRFEVPPKRE